MDHTELSIQNTTEPDATASPDTKPAEAIAAPPKRLLRGFGVMSERAGEFDQPEPPREVIEQAASTARSTGHRFDLMRYLRLRRRE